MKDRKYMKICDAHIHVGYFPRIDKKEIFYYSPARISYYLRKANIEEFIFSSTNATWDTTGNAMHKEALEVKRIFKNKAHAFFWLNEEYFRTDLNLEKLPNFYEGLKLHGGQTRWIEKKDLLNRVFSIASDRNFKIQIHTSNDEINRIKNYIPFCEKYPKVRIDLAHGKKLEDAKIALKECNNVFIDTSFMKKDDIKQLYDINSSRIMFGSDIPAFKYFWNVSITKYLRNKIQENIDIGGLQIIFDNFSRFINDVRI